MKIFAYRNPMCIEFQVNPIAIDQRTLVFGECDSDQDLIHLSFQLGQQFSW